MSKAFAGAALAAVISVLGCGSSLVEDEPVASESNLSSHRVSIRSAAPIELPFPVDCNSPAFWTSGPAGPTLHVFNSEPYYASPDDLLTVRSSSGPDLFSLSSHEVSRYASGDNHWKWMEAISQQDDGLYGFFHWEPAGLCEGIRTTAPRIGAARSTDGGRTWHELAGDGGVILREGGRIRCEAHERYFFGGGNGDFSAVHVGEYFYFFFTSYSADLSQQGVAVARLPVAERRVPFGKVTKWHQGAFSSPGIDGPVTPIFPARGDYGHGLFWGPTVSWNEHLKVFVMLLNHLDSDGFNGQEGIYVSFNPDLEDPNGWSPPQKILDPREVMSEEEIAAGGAFYPQLMGLEPGLGTDSYAGHVARFFLRGKSRWEIVFD